VNTDGLFDYVSAAHACTWLGERTGEVWTLQRLLEAHLFPCVWIEWEPGAPEAVFQGHASGFLAWLFDANDIKRLKVVGDGKPAQLTMSYAPDGRIFRLRQPYQFPVEELRFKGDDVRALLLSRVANASPATLRRITKTLRRDVLAPVIELAQSHCRNPNDVHEVWVQLQELARAQRPPLLGETEDGLQYRRASDGIDTPPAYFTKDSLRKRLSRRGSR
jgi:hypothetical protein